MVLLDILYNTTLISSYVLLYYSNNYMNLLLGLTLLVQNDCIFGLKYINKNIMALNNLFCIDIVY